MITLKEQEAVDYLERVKSTLKPKKDTFANIPALACMIDTQQAYFRRLIQTGSPELVVMTIDSTGLPELASWRVDLAKGAQEFEKIRQQRSLAVGPLFQQMANISISGVTQEKDRLISQFASDDAFASVISKIPQSIRDEYKKDYPAGFRVFDNIPGLLTTDCSSKDILFCRMYGDPYGNNNHKISIGNRVGFKFIDGSAESGEMAKPPLMMMVTREIGDDSINRILTVDGNKSFHEVLGQYHALTCRDERYLASMKAKEVDMVSENKRLYGVEALSHRDFFSNSFHPLTRSLSAIYLRAYHEVDFTSVQSSSVDTFISVLPRLDELSAKVTQGGKALLNASLSSVANLELLADCVQTLDSILNTIPEDSLRRSLQLAWAESMNPVRQSIISEAEKSEKQAALPGPSGDNQQSKSNRPWWRFGL